ncbi:hypothetical protein CONPUDRAFT_151582 [Coniophora puteana RWD-64-598 SS2]|uniref:Tc1-like transposase DDE domain-containing protein n=1 Tax=Coniophora puteana (strain RWD-64-598) TaxID=741705 RepID=A0A5M3MZV9_CONPW|nr:uncharacterized protein CONPUDRAFT_151582 [Coniophora puteana RWD-64-598 SS2]EIW84566.1 hypothetical protein CONPUDRAFT_151582 [Coniophora puteana RWD-64-598 SS2]
MAPRKKGSKREHGSSGKFISNKKPHIDHSDISESGHQDSSDWDLEADDEHEDPGYISDSQSDSGSDDEYASIPSPSTWISAATKAKALEVLEHSRISVTVGSMRGAELKFDGPIDKPGGARDKTGKARGPYGVGGLSARRARELRKAARDKKESGELDEGRFQKEVEAVNALEKKKPRENTNLASFFGPKPSTPSSGLRTLRQGCVGVVEIEDNSDMPLAHPLPVSENGPVIMSIDSDQDEESLTHVGSAAPSSPSDEQEVEVADGIAEFVEGVLDEGEPKTWEELQALAEEGLKNARKRKSYRDEVVFASLVQLYRFAPRQGRLRGSLRVARNLGRGPAFARVLNAHARHFEAMGSLKPGQQGKRPSGSSGSGESALDDEAFSLGVKSFLRTLAPGTVTPTLLQHHLCKAKRARKPKLALSPEEMDLADCEDLVNDSEDESRPSDCCLLRILELQEDFQNELCLLQKVVEEAGNQCHFLPKFHPELNPIEYYWGWCKNYFRERSNGNFERGKRLLQEAVDMCPLITIRRFFRRASRYLSIYHLGATGVVAEFAAKRYRGHRGVMQKDIDQAQAEWEVKQTKLTVGQSLH